jgi:hypothetical protein
MRTITIAAGEVIPDLLDAALDEALTTRYIGLASAGAVEPILVYLSPAASTADEDIAREVVRQHYPAFLKADKTSIRADGEDVATLSVRLREESTIRLLVNGQPYAVALSKGVGRVEIVSKDPTPITIGVETPGGKQIDILKMEAK